MPEASQPATSSTNTPSKPFLPRGKRGISGRPGKPPPPLPPPLPERRSKGKVFLVLRSSPCGCSAERSEPSSACGGRGCLCRFSCNLSQSQFMLTIIAWLLHYVKSVILYFW